MVTPTRVGLAEREHELRAIEELLAAARAGEGRGVVVEGPPGIGKSSLLAAARAAAEDFRVLRARGSELERDTPFSVVRQLLEPVLAASSGAGRERLLAGAARLAEPVLTAPPSDGPGADAGAAAHGLYWLIANLAAAGRLALLVDDVHWADLASLRWLAYVAPRLDGLPLALLVAARSGAESPESRPLLDNLIAQPHVTVLRPDDLGEAAVARVVEEALGGPVADRFAAACRQVTGGNPFLLGELLRELARAGVVPTGANARVVERLSARGVSQAALSRLRRQSPGARALAEAVVVLGDDVELAVAAQTARLSDAQAAGAASELAAAFILEDRRPLAFVHPLVRASVYAALGAEDRDRWHTRVASVLSEAGAPAERVAPHLLAAEPAGEPATVERLREAARAALARGATDAAVACLRRARREPPPPDLVAQLELELGTAELRAHDPDAATRHLSAALRGLTDPRTRARAAEGLGTALFWSGQGERAVAVLTEAIDELPAEERDLGLRLQAARCGAGHVSPAAWRKGAVARFEARSQPTTAADRLRLGERAWRGVFDAPIARVRRLSSLALEDGALMRDPTPNAHGFYLPILALIFSGDLADATRYLTDALAWTSRHGSAFAFVQASHCRALCWWYRGALAEAEADAEAAHANDPDRAGTPPPGTFALVEVHLARGDPERASALWDAQRVDEHLHGRSAIIQRYTRAHLRLAQGRPQEALDDLLACGDLEAAWGIVNPVMSMWRADGAELLHRLGRDDEARELAEAGLEQCRRFAARRPLGMALRSAGVIAGDDGISRLEEAVAVLTPSDARLEHARALVDLGSALRRAGRRTAAREPLRQAMEVARRCGADPLAARAHDELVAAGARPRRDPIESRSRLTASEARVARLAAQNMSNREIAQALFLTEKTIEMHLTRCYRKLDIGSRSQLARVLTPDVV